MQVEIPSGQVEKGKEDPETPEDPTCDICFDQVTRNDVYPLPCACKLTMCWGCVHLQFHTTQKTSRCPCCRVPTRYENRHNVMVHNYARILKMVKKGLLYQHAPVNFLDNKLDPVVEQHQLNNMEDIIVGIHYLANVDTNGQCVRSLRQHPAMKKYEDQPIWAWSQRRCPREKRYHRWLRVLKIKRLNQYLEEQVLVWN